MTSESKPPNPLLALARAVADGDEIDWGSAAESTGTGDQPLVTNLRALARVAAAHRESANVAPAAAGETGEKPAADNEKNRETGVPLFRWGHLEIIERISAGPCSEVYRARDRELDHEVALKLLHPRGSERRTHDQEAIHEAQLLARVQHPNVARIHGAGEHEGRVGLWMELIRGQNLDQMLDARGPLGAAEVTGVGSCLCQAVAAVHHAGVLHRDIKTRNIMRETGGRFVLLDLGMGCDPECRADSDREGAGTPLYMAPEVMRGEPATVQSDIYSLGVVLFRLLTGTFPITGRSWLDVRQAHAEGKRRWLGDVRPDLPPPLVRAIDRAIDPDPHRRYSSAGEFEHALALAGVGKLRVPAWSKLLAAAALAFIFVWFLRAPFMRYDIHANLYRLQGGTLDPLTQHSSVSAGDRLVLDLEASRPLYVYVVSHDDTGRNLLLFPMEGSHLGNPLPGGKRHRLPGMQDGMQLAWNVTGDGRHEHLVIVASPKPLDDFAGTISQLPQPENQADPELAANARNMEGAGRAMLSGSLQTGNLDGGPTGLETGHLVAILEKLRTRSQSTRGLWVHQIDLEFSHP